jgi:hypothetical protein
MARLPGRAVARTGLRMMPTFPPLPLKFRKAGFPRYGFKAGMSDGPSRRRQEIWRRAVCVRPSCTSPPVTFYPVQRRGTRCAGAPPFKRLWPLYPRGPRSGPGYVVPVHLHLLTPSAPLASTPRLRRSAVYTRCPRCAPYRWRLGDRRLVPSFRWLFCIDMSSSETPGVLRLLTPSSFAVDAGLRPVATVSAHPISSPSDSREGHHFRGFTTVHLRYDLSICLPSCRS